MHLEQIHSYYDRGSEDLASVGSERCLIGAGRRQVTRSTSRSSHAERRRQIGTSRLKGRAAETRMPWCLRRCGARPNIRVSCLLPRRPSAPAPPHCHTAVWRWRPPYPPTFPFHRAGRWARARSWCFSRTSARHDIVGPRIPGASAGFRQRAAARRAQWTRERMLPASVRSMATE